MNGDQDGTTADHAYSSAQENKRKLAELEERIKKLEEEIFNKKPGSS